MNFGNILKGGQKRFSSKCKQLGWERCNWCKNQRLLFEYFDEAKVKWSLCEECINCFVKEENDEPTTV